MSLEQRPVEPALALRDITKRYGSVVALDGVDMVVRAGTVHALLGENGAGKTTLMHVAVGMARQDAGTVRLFGAEVPNHSPRGAVRAGVGMVHQHLSLVPALSVVENVELGGRGLLRTSAAHATLDALMSTSGLRVPADRLVRDLSVVEQQRVEILKALRRGARALILDEPTSVLAPGEADDLLRWLRAFADAGGSVVLVTHKLRDALSVADDITVLRGGRAVLAGGAAGASEDGLAKAMFPERDEIEPLPESARGEPVVRAAGLMVDLGSDGRIRGVSLEIHRGDVVGVAAVEGAGHHALLAVLGGRGRISAGTLQLPERIGFIPADRLGEAMIADFTLTENVALRDLRSRRGRMPWQSLGARTRALIDRFAIVAASESVRTRTLSGGNQQRLVVARELEGGVDLLVADNPTRGLDLRATTFVHEQLRRTAAQGAAVVFYSSDLDEILRVATRVLVVFHGGVTDVGLDRDAIGRAMLGAVPA